MIAQVDHAAAVGMRKVKRGRAVGGGNAERAAVGAGDLGGEWRGPAFRKPMYLLLNLALGSSSGKVDETKLHARYEVRYLRVYQLAVP